MSNEVTILRELLASPRDFVSGERLAEQIQLSRVAVWERITELRKQGFKIQAARSRGYKMLARPENLNASLVEALTSIARTQPIRFFFHEEIDSTNSEAERLLARGEATPFVVIAARQTRGRGRFGRVWHSPQEGNLYLSVATRPQLPPERMHLFTLWMGVNICELLGGFCHIAPTIKWPNDLLYDGKKVGGMLTEARVDADAMRDLIFGLGLNVNSRPQDWPSDVAKTATSLCSALGRELDINQLSAAIVGRILMACDRFAKEKPEKIAAEFAEIWARFDLLRGRRIAVLQGAERFEGVANGIDDQGSLIVRRDDGKSMRFRAGEVTLEKNTLRR